MPTYAQLQQYTSAQAGQRMSLEDLFGLSIVDRDLTAPPSTPAEAARYIVATGATGAWSGQDGKVAVSYDAGVTWTFLAPFEGLLVWIADEDLLRLYTGSTWTDPTLTSRVVQKTLTVLNPSSAENATLFHADKGYTITKIVAVLRGSSSPSVTWTLRKASDRSAGGTEVVTGGTVTTSVTTGSVVTSFNSATIAAGDFLWLTTSAASGTVGELSVTVHMVQTSP